MVKLYLEQVYTCQWRHLLFGPLGCKAGFCAYAFHVAAACYHKTHEPLLYHANHGHLVPP